MSKSDERLGRVTLEPSGPVVAGSVGTWRLRYTVGSYGIDEGGTVKLAFRFASDWERPQMDDPAAPAYTTVTTSGDAKLEVRFDPKAHVRPWMKCLVIDVHDGCLAPGDEVVITLGDRSGGCPGIRTQSFIESAHELRVLVDPTNACLVRPLPSSPVLEVVAGEPVALVVIVPTRVQVGRRARVFVRGEDRWGNPTAAPPGVELSWHGDAEGSIDRGHLELGTPGSGRVVATWSGRTFPGNPVTGHAELPRFRPYWADLHAQSGATVGTGTEAEYFAFGRDQACLDVMSHQGNDFQVTDEDWRRLQEVGLEFHRDGSFVVFPGFEWSANTPAGGDRNVIYRSEGRPIFRSSHWQVPQVPEDDRTPAHPASVLFDRLREHVERHDVLVAAHCGGRYADIRRYHGRELEPLVEVASCWGVFEWLLWDAFDCGYRVGVMCNSDGHKGRPGAEGPGAGRFGIFGGLTCILAEALTRDAVFDALKARRCYGTTGPRIDLAFTVDGHPMGSEIHAGGPVRVEASARGTAPLEALHLLRGREVVHTVRPEAFAEGRSSRRIRLCWGGARIRGRGRRAVWDGEVVVEGARIERAATFAFDSPNDGILEQGPDSVRLRSRTTGDLDGLDLWLDQARSGRVRFRSALGTVEADLGDLDARGIRADLGGLDLHVTIVRYPEVVEETHLVLHHTVDTAQEVTTPLLVKAVQTDGHLAWSSPVYVDRKTSA